MSRTFNGVPLSRRVRSGMIVAKWGAYIVPYNPSNKRMRPIGVYSGEATCWDMFPDSMTVMKTIEPERIRVKGSASVVVVL